MKGAVSLIGPSEVSLSLVIFILIPDMVFHWGNVGVLPLEGLTISNHQTIYGTEATRVTSASLGSITLR